MLDLRFLEFEHMLKNDFTPEIKTAVFNRIMINKDKIQSNFAENTQNLDENSSKTEVLYQNRVDYEIKDITPKSIFRRK